MSIFLDTGFYFALLAKKDTNHQRAVKILSELTEGIHGQIYTSNFVFDESMTLLNVRTGGNRKDLLDRMRSLFLGRAPIAKMISVENRTLDQIAALQIKLTKKTNPISFTDCSTIFLCNERKIPKIVSFDDHYQGLLTQV
ncbi:MAG: PIN domain-containing protein [Promethearchaeota archaeon]|nr:MAG: PIN domain-containing protein [Candidatus Lokiarchaeota archaeon]